MNSGHQGADSLVERYLGFAYDYPMHCDGCGRTSRVAAQVYWEESQNDALAPCEHCGHDIHFGSAVVALRDAGDLALSSDDVASLAWYHTSTYRDWPSPEYAALVRPQLEAQPLRRMIPQHLRDRQLAKALHVGTYEAAIENMLRRMRNQNDATSEFYLHRVSLNLVATDINGGFRDENHEDASALSLDELGPLLAVRYLNVREAPGSISLAIHPAVIDTIQTLPLPAASLAADPQAGVVEAVARIDRELAAAVAAGVDTSDIKPSELRLRVFLAREGDADELALQVDECEERIGNAWHELDEMLAQEYLAGVGPFVRDDFTAAMRVWRHRTEAMASSYHHHYRAHSAALTAGRDVITETARRAPRTLPLV
jgi:hypothetical protein